jgi:hypothetical protein
LLPFGEPALRHFVFLERPEGMQLGDPLLHGVLERAVPAVELGEIVPQLQDFATIDDTAPASFATYHLRQLSRCRMRVSESAR